MTTRLEDRYEIRELSARYALLVDTRNFEDLGELFSADAVYGRRDQEMGRGRAGIIAFVRAHFDANPLPTYHYAHDFVLDLDPAHPDRARGVVSGHAETRPNGQLQVLAVRYEDEYLREAGRWRFSRRWLHFPLQ